MSLTQRADYSIAQSRAHANVSAEECILHPSVIRRLVR